MWLVRNAEGHVSLRRIYDFEYSDTGDDQRKGNITMVADTVTAQNIGPRSAPEGVTWH